MKFFNLILFVLINSPLFLVGNKDYCGLAYLSSRRNFAFAVVNVDCATGQYSYGHEIGHNFEMNHDRGSENACNTSGFNYGYRAPDASFRTILAYNCATPQCDNIPVTENGCPRVQRFSNTRFRFQGKPAGDQFNDNAKQWNDNRATVAAFYPAMNCTSNIQCNDNNGATIDTCNVATAVCVFTPNPPTKAPNPAPAKGPTKSPTKRPVLAPTRRPTKRPTRAPVISPIQRPAPAVTTKRPTKSPTRRQTKSPTKRPTRAPVKSPIQRSAPVATKRPTKSPTRRQTKSPTKRPIRPPVKSPIQRSAPAVATKRPTKVPIQRPIRTPIKSPIQRPIRTPTIPIPRPIRIPIQRPVKSPMKRSMMD